MFLQISQKRLLLISIHICFWVLFFFVPHILYNLPMRPEIIQIRIIEMMILLLIFYGNALYLVPKLLIPKKYLLYFLITISIIVSVSQIGTYARSVFFASEHITRKEQMELRQQYRIQQQEIGQFHKHKSVPAHRMERRFTRPNPGFLSIIVLVTLALSSAYGYAQAHNNREKQIKELEKEQLASELAFLKTQINPHFLFNVLNSMYSLSLQKAEILPQVILRLSDLLRYMTYDSDAEYVPIEKEISYLTNYIELQKIRLSNQQNIEFIVENSYNKASIAPLILIAFIENAFKHGVIDKEKTAIHIHIVIDNEKITLFVKNNTSTQQHKDNTKGIGVQNVKRRLEIMYPQKHSLDISSTESTYIVSLSITHS